MTKLAWSARAIFEAEAEVCWDDDDAEFVDQMARFLLEKARGNRLGVLAVHGPFAP